MDSSIGICKDKDRFPYKSGKGRQTFVFRLRADGLQKRAEVMYIIFPFFLANNPSPAAGRGFTVRDNYLGVYSGIEIVSSWR